MQNKSNHILTRIMVCLSPVILGVLQAWNPDATLVGLCNLNTWGMFTYHFFHASWIHLTLNWWCMSGLLLNRRYNAKELLVCYFIACLYPFESNIPIVGLSGIVYAMAGFYTRDMTTVGIMLFTIAVTMFIPDMAAGLHLWCYAIALSLSYDKK